MKTCPGCQKTYNDPTLNFCLDCGATLSQGSGNAPPPTVFINQPQPTNPNSPGEFQIGAPNNWGNPNQQFSMQPPAKKSPWLLVLGILGGLILLCGGGFAGFVVWVASLDESNANTNENVNANAAYISNANKTDPTPGELTSSRKIDLSKWAREEYSAYGNTEYKNGEFIMSSRQKGYYYVLVSRPEYKTENAITTVTVKNINNANSVLGYGLVVHSNPVPLTQDYAFLINSANKKYRVVRHSPGAEKDVVNWTTSTAIKDGTQENVLEIRDQNKKMGFYINGQLVTTVSNTDGYEGGVPGLYSGDAVSIAFTNFEVKQ